jgi:hypothetical protein
MAAVLDDPEEMATKENRLLAQDRREGIEEQGRTGKDAVDVVRSTPFLVSQHVAAKLLLFPLN